MTRLLRIGIVFVPIAMLLANAGMAQAAPQDPPAPHAPRITCSITTQFWCIAQSAATVNMVSQGAYRTWSITPRETKRPSVVLRENQVCATPAAYRPSRMKDEVAIGPGKRRQRIVTLALTADRGCTVRISYPMGNDDRAREAERIAKYGVLVCDKGTCRGSLLDID